MSVPLVPLFDRLPEIYRTRDAEQSPPDQLRAYLAAIEESFGALHENIAQLYEDLFIDTCDDWVIPYLADLLGTTHLKGEPRTLRADVADTIALRRRKGTLGAIERLAVNLTGWACRGVELRENLGWSQHLNHQRPDAGGVPPYGADHITRFDVPRGGTAPIRDPAALALLGTPFDNFAYTADVKPAIDDARHINLPNLAVFLWRLAAYRLPLVQPLAKGVTDLGPPATGLARFAVRFDLHPLDMPVRLFNTSPGFLRPGTSGGVVAPLTEADARTRPHARRPPDQRLAGRPSRSLCPGRLLQRRRHPTRGLRPRCRSASILPGGIRAAAHTPKTENRMAMAFPWRQSMRVGNRIAQTAALRRDHHRPRHRARVDRHGQ